MISTCTFITFKLLYNREYCNTPNTSLNVSSISKEYYDWYPRAPCSIMIGLEQLGFWQKFSTKTGLCAIPKRQKAHGKRRLYIALVSVRSKYSEERACPSQGTMSTSVMMPRVRRRKCLPERSIQCVPSCECEWCTNKDTPAHSSLHGPSKGFLRDATYGWDGE